MNSQSRWDTSVCNRISYSWGARRVAGNILFLLNLLILLCVVPFSYSKYKYKYININMNMNINVIYKHIYLGVERNIDFFPQYAIIYIYLLFFYRY
jgi:hypothetical protein